MYVTQTFIAVTPAGLHAYVQDCRRPTKMYTQCALQRSVAAASGHARARMASQ